MGEQWTMPILEGLVEQDIQTPYKDVIVLHINHCMDNSFAFNEMLAKVYGQVVFVAAPYNDKQMSIVERQYTFYTAKISESAYHIYRNGNSLNKKKRSFIGVTGEMIRQAILLDILPQMQGDKKFLIIEDGGYHYDVLYLLFEEYPFLRDKMLGVVEQTTSGTKRCMHKGKNELFLYPCVSISRSMMKMNLESVFIGQRIVEELNQFLYSINEYINFHSILISGYGIIGRSVAKTLSAYPCSVFVYDNDPIIRKTAIEDGYVTFDKMTKESFKDNMIWIGCVGEPAFTVDMLLEFMKSDAKQLILSSGSSKNIEFITLIDLIDGKESYDNLSIEKVHHWKYADAYEVSYHQKTKRIILVAEGKPVNFYREDVISLTYKMIDLVFAEMYLLSKCLCDFELDNDLMLLGVDPHLNALVNEKELMLSWFKENGYGDAKAFEHLVQSHPNAKYLCERFWENEN